MVCYAAFLFALPSLALAATLSPRQAPPNCVVGCIGTSTSSTSCATSDFQCLCTSTEFINVVQACLDRDCSESEYDQGVALANQYCASVGVTINVPERGSSDGTESSSSAVAEESATSATEEASSSSSSSSSTTASSSASSSSAMSSSASSSSSTIAPSSSGTVPSAQSTTSTTNTPTSDAESLFAHGHSLVMTSTAILAGAGVAVAIFA